MSNYVIAQAGTPTDLEAQVIAYLDDGCVLVGGLVVHQLAGRPHFYQAMHQPDPAPMQPTGEPGPVKGGPVVQAE